MNRTTLIENMLKMLDELENLIKYIEKKQGEAAQ